MNTTAQSLTSANFPALAFTTSANSPMPFVSVSTRTTADLLLRVAAQRRFVRAVQALRRR